MALMGAWQTIKKPSTLYADILARSFLMVFMCIWIPMVFALLDAVNFVHSAQNSFALPALSFCRHLPHPSEQKKKPSRSDPCNCLFCSIILVNRRSNTIFIWKEPVRLPLRVRAHYRNVLSQKYNCPCPCGFITSIF